MTELEDQVRAELRARAEMASADAAEQPVALLAGLERRIRRTQVRRRIAASAVGALAVAAAIATPLALLSPGFATSGGPATAVHGSGALSDPSLTPQGWTAIPYGDAQVSVPSSWGVQTDLGSDCGMTANGAVWLGYRMSASGSMAFWPGGSHVVKFGSCRLPATTVFMSNSPAHLPRWTGQRLNGIPVVRLPSPRGSISYAAPGLHAEVQAIGPKAGQVIRTLTRAPIAVVLARGAVFTVPASWHWHVFGGVRFATPGTWRVQHVRTWGTCLGSPVLDHILLLSTARTRGCKGQVGMGSGLAAEWAQASGLTVGAGRLASDDPGYGWAPLRSWRLGGLQVFMNSYPSEQSYGNPLTVEVLVPGRRYPVTFLIGLGGTGAIPRTILDSIRKP